MRHGLLQEAAAAQEHDLAAIQQQTCALQSLRAAAQAECRNLSQQHACWQLPDASAAKRQAAARARLEQQSAELQAAAAALAGTAGKLARLVSTCLGLAGDMPHAATAAHVSCCLPHCDVRWPAAAQIAVLKRRQRHANWPELLGAFLTVLVRLPSVTITMPHSIGVPAPNPCRPALSCSSTLMGYRM